MFFFLILKKHYCFSILHHHYVTNTRQALLRPGRFDRQIVCELPTLPERRDIAALYLSRIKVADPAAHVETLASLTAGLRYAVCVCMCVCVYVFTLNKQRKYLSQYAM